MHKINLLSHNWLVIRDNNRVVENLLPDMRGTVYDLGCGIRPYEQDILQFADSYVGVDWGSTQHTLSADIVSDLNKALPIPDESADTVVSFQVLEHLCEPQSMLNEAFRILKPNGKLILTVPFQWWIHEEPHDYFRYTKYGLRYLLEKAGFDEITVRSVSGFFVVWIMKFNYFSVRFIRGPKIIRRCIRYLLMPFWLILQMIAPILDKLDREPDLEASGYIVVAKKT